MNAALRADILALLEDGPKRTRELATWLERPATAMSELLQQLAQEGAVERIGHAGGSRWQLPPSGSVSSTERPKQEVVPVTPSQRTTPRPAPGTARSTEPEHASRSVSPDGEDYVVVWSGKGPLPGMEDLPGMGSALRGMHFHVGNK